MEHTTSQEQEKVISGLKHGLDAAEELLREAAQSTGDRATELRERAMASLKSTREDLLVAQETALQKGKQAVRVTDDYVHDNPWQAVGIAAGVGLVLGLLIARR